MTPLFKGYGWDIYDVSEEMYERRDLVVFANHRACQGSDPKNRHTMNSWWPRDLKEHCIMCDAIVPDNIQALVTLYTYGMETP